MSSPSRIRLVGLVASAASVVTLGITVIAQNRNAGLWVISPAAQLTLLAAALILLVVQIGLYVISVRTKKAAVLQHVSKHDLPRASS